MNKRDEKICFNRQSYSEGDHVIQSLQLTRDGTQLTVKAPFQSCMLPVTEAVIQICHLKRAVRGQISAEHKLILLRLWVFFSQI